MGKMRKYKINKKQVVKDLKEESNNNSFKEISVPKLFFNNFFSKNKGQKIASIFVIIIMGLSVLGFAFLQSPQTRTNNSGDLPLDNYQLENGEFIWAARKNNELFIFQNGIEGFDNNSKIKNIANQIKEKEFIELSYSNYSNFQSEDLLLRNILQANKIDFSFNPIVSKCEENVLFLKFEGEKINNIEANNCIFFEIDKNEPIKDIENLIYFLVQ